MSLTVKRLWLCPLGTFETFHVDTGVGFAEVAVRAPRNVRFVDVGYRTNDLGGFDVATWEAEQAWRAHFGALADLPAEAVIGC